MESDLEEGLVLLDGLGDGHLDLVAQELRHLVARLDVLQHLLGVRSLQKKNISGGVLKIVSCNLDRIVQMAYKCGLTAQFLQSTE